MKPEQTVRDFGNKGEDTMNIKHNASVMPTALDNPISQGIFLSIMTAFCTVAQQRLPHKTKMLHS